MKRLGEKGPKGHFWAKMAKFGPKVAKMAKTRFFVKKTKTLFSSPYPYISSREKSEKTNEAFPRKRVTHGRTGVRTDARTDGAEFIGSSHTSVGNQ